jgi:hypothetical protein
MRRVQQKHSNGCVVATTAMLLGMEYDEALLLFGEGALEEVQKSGFGDYVMESILVEKGFAFAKKYRVMQPGNSVRDHWPIDPWLDVPHCALVLHQSGMAHSVVVLPGGAVLDPNSETRTKLTDFLEVCSITAVIAPDKIQLVKP